MQLASLLVSIVTLGAVCFTAYVYYRILNAQLLRDRYDLYLRVCEPVSDGKVDDFRLYPDDWIKSDTTEFAKLFGKDIKKTNKTKIKRYIYFTDLYEYLAFTKTMQAYKFKDPLGEHWSDMWLSELINQEEFLIVHKNYCKYYPGFARIVDDQLKQKSASCRIQQTS